MAYQWIFFDLDGTLTDPAVGITGGVQYALEKFGIHEANREKLYPFIGPPLTESLEKYYGFSLEQGTQAAVYYREYYKKQGMYENEVYEGIPEMLGRLKSAGKRLFVVTLKGENFAREILEHFHLMQYFEDVFGQRVDGLEMRKSQILEQVVEKYGISDLSQTVMVGDREHDIFAAKEMGIPDIGVLYGYGSREELEQAGAGRIVKGIRELEEVLL